MTMIVSWKTCCMNPRRCRNGCHPRDVESQKALRPYQQKCLENARVANAGHVRTGRYEHLISQAARREQYAKEAKELAAQVIANGNRRHSEGT
jgi:hypothetical protein